MPDLVTLEDVLALQERPRALGSEAMTFEPAWTGLTEVGSVTKAGVVVTAGDLVLLVATITSAGGTSAAVAGSTYLALPVPTRYAGVAGVADATTLAGLASGVVTTTGRLYVPSWVATADTIVINATYRRA